jgi:hypothetical protein
VCSLKRPLLALPSPSPSHSHPRKARSPSSRDPKPRALFRFVSCFHIYICPGLTAYVPIRSCSCSCCLRGRFNLARACAAVKCRAKKQKWFFIFDIDKEDLPDGGSPCGFRRLKISIPGLDLKMERFAWSFFHFKKNLWCCTLLLNRSHNPPLDRAALDHHMLSK